MKVFSYRRLKIDCKTKPNKSQDFLRESTMHKSHLCEIGQYMFVCTCIPEQMDGLIDKV